jgi:hypothetical protein
MDQRIQTPRGAIREQSDHVYCVFSSRLRHDHSRKMHEVVKPFPVVLGGFISIGITQIDKRVFLIFGMALFFGEKIRAIIFLDSHLENRRISVSLI